MSQIGLEPILLRAPVLPVVTLSDWRAAAPLARTLVEAGVPAVEIALRTPAALDAIRAAAEEVPEAIVGAGTVLNARDLDAAIEAGASFAVSPGQTEALLDAGRDCAIPFLPGVANPSDLMAALARGYAIMKLYPASVVGGVSMLKAVAGPFPQTRFCPTGGVTLKNAREYLALDNVICVGGSWLTPEDALAGEDWERIAALAREAVETLSR